jgi:transcriptional regulator with PAS, ATPase and Fis domain
MTVKQMKEELMDKALVKYKTVEEAAKVLGISSRTLFTYKKRKENEPLGNGL